MNPQYHIDMRPDIGLVNYDRKKFVLYSYQTGTEYPIDVNEVMRLKDDAGVRVSGKVKTYIDIAF